MTYILLKTGSFLLSIALGYLAKRSGILKKGSYRIVTAIVLRFTLPCAIIHSFSNLTLQGALLWLIVMGAVCDLVLSGIGFLLGRTKEEKTFNIINFSGFNVGCFSLPYIQSFLGPTAAVTACLFDAGNTLLCTGGTYGIASAYQRRSSGGAFAELVRKIFSSVPLDTYIVMLTLTLFGIRLPSQVTQVTGVIAVINGYLAMFMIGLGVEFSFQHSQLRVIVKTLSVRLLFAAVLSLVFWLVLPFETQVKQVLMIALFAPLSVVCPAFTSKCDGDVALSSALNTASIILSFCILTVLFLFVI